MSMGWRSLGSRVLDVAFPLRCAACGRGGGVAAIEACGLCGDCVGDLEVFHGGVCPKCSTPRPGDRPIEDCPVCHEVRWAFERVVALGAYDGLLRRLVLDAKGPAGADAAAALGRLLAERQDPPLEAPALVAPIPQHWRRRLARRADGVASLARGVAQGWGLPFAKLLGRNRSTRRQTEVAPSERAANVRRAFTVRRPARVAGATVVLVDDVLTTGSTCHAAARALRVAGATRVLVAVAARRVGAM